MQLQQLLDEAEKNLYRNDIKQANAVFMQIYEQLKREKTLSKHRNLIKNIAYQLHQENSELTELFFQLYFQVKKEGDSSEIDNYATQNINNYATLNMNNYRKIEDESVIHWTYATYLHKKNKYQQAQKHFQIALSSNPNNSEYMYCLCQSLKEQGNYEKASIISEKLIGNICQELEKEDFDPLEFPQFQAYLLIAIQLARLQTRYEWAVQLYGFLVHIWGSQTHTYYFEMGQAYKMMQEYDKAQQCYEKTIELQKRVAPCLKQENPYNYLMNAEMLEKCGNYLASIQNYHIVLEIMPDHLETMRCLALLLARIDRKQEANNLFISCLQAEPNNIQNCFNYTLFLLINGEVSEALQFLGLKLKDNSENMELLNLYAVCNGEYMSHWDKSQKIYEYCLSIQQDTKIAHCYARCLMELGLKQEAEAKFLELIDIMTRNNTSYSKNDELMSIKYSYCTFLIRTKQNQKSSSLIEEIISSGEKNPQFLFNYALFLRYTQKKEKAKTYFQKAIQMSPENPMLLIFSAVNLIDLKQASEAFAYFKQAFHSLQKSTVFFLQKQGNKLKINESYFGYKQWQITLIRQNLGYFNKMVEEREQIRENLKHKSYRKKQRSNLITESQEQEISKLCTDFMVMIVDFHHSKIERQNWETSMKTMTTLLVNQIEVLKQQNAILQKEISQELIKFQQEVIMLKQQLLWSEKLDAKFQKLKAQNKLRSLSYGRRMCWMLCTSIQALRTMRKRAVKASNDEIMLKIGGFVNKIGLACELVPSLPGLGEVCAIVSEFAAACISQQQNLAIQKIVQVTEEIDEESLICQAVSEAVEILLSNEEHLEILQKVKDAQWFESNIKSVIGRSNFVQRFMSIDFQQQAKQALLDCSRVISRMLKIQLSLLTKESLKAASIAVLQSKLQWLRMKLKRSAESADIHHRLQIIKFYDQRKLPTPKNEPTPKNKLMLSPSNINKPKLQRTHSQNRRILEQILAEDHQCEQHHDSNPDLQEIHPRLRVPKANGGCFTEQEGCHIV